MHGNLHGVAATIVMMQNITAARVLRKILGQRYFSALPSVGVKRWEGSPSNDFSIRLTSSTRCRGFVSHCCCNRNPDQQHIRCTRTVALHFSLMVLCPMFLLHRHTHTCVCALVPTSLLLPPFRVIYMSKNSTSSLAALETEIQARCCVFSHANYQLKPNFN